MFDRLSNILKAAAILAVLLQARLAYSERPDAVLAWHVQAFWLDESAPHTLTFETFSVTDSTIPSAKWVGVFDAAKDRADWKVKRISSAPFYAIVTTLTNGVNDDLYFAFDDTSFTVFKESTIIVEGTSKNGIDLQGYDITRVGIYFVDFVIYGPQFPPAVRLAFVIYGTAIAGRTDTPSRVRPRYAGSRGLIRETAWPLRPIPRSEFSLRQYQ